MVDPIRVDVVIVGAGFSGCLALHEMRCRGLSARIIEANDGFGGVWHSNRYPGARVDSILPFYQLTKPEVYRGFTFTEKYPDSSALRDYFSHLDETLNLRTDTIFGHRVVKASFSDERATWNFETHRELTATSRFAIFAGGTTQKPHVPDLPGLDTFQGQIVHPANWPSDLELEGKRVGLIGQGASGIQILEQLAKDNHDITLFIRTPCLAVPMQQKTDSMEESQEKKSGYDALFEKAKYGQDAGYPYLPATRMFEDETPEQHKQVFEERWSHGGLMATMGYNDITTNADANATMYRFWRDKARARMTDRAKMAIVAPTEPFQWIGGKRSALEQNYFEMIDRPNVKLVNLKKAPISRVTPSGIVVGGEGEGDGDDLHELDVLIFSTGYDSVTGGMYDMNILDRHGRSLREKWKDGIHTFAGMMIPDMPNAFLLYGRQAPTALANGPTFIELQVEWIGKVLDGMERRGEEMVEATQEAAREWADRTFSIWNSLRVRDQDSWWVGSNIPGKRREPLIWFGGTKLWWDLCNVGLVDWEPFTSRL
ncbi:Flavin monooxygenase-like protein [Cordyceps fumosorosea ARSEF 2679]|uniref:Flavin monooxygenase-like protein n=1 Tax=Cordyceps fumosorosea (strain ARSEF 2679) TaxID=1081104 RepID=A0A167Q694_CORFA|nr:Flavin monooxygenase-like protein [Cordyceps fumosorosea ARSEF 2679]OAA57336.1 Flavin monooxygenase-like protein [Cordyceps fumosorosea ARSEF 2679]